ncbi:MAG: response regulator transcription factor [Deltaproteobacteria bacterium]|nr:response regulator transcription factor [Deltaproteobacteria bacterium]
MSDAASEIVVLVVEDDAAIREGLVDALQAQGYTVRQAATAPEGQRLAQQGGCHLVLLDLMLPGGDGIDVLQQIRRSRPELPVIILTARGRETDRVRGLRVGADDYVVKPFSLKELLARVDAVLRRIRVRSAVTGPRASGLRVAQGRVDLARREVCFDDGERRELSERESSLLAYLVEHGERAVSRDEILQHVWHLNPARFQTRTIDMHVARLRDKLRDPGSIVTVRGKGYMLGADVRPLEDSASQPQ